jgi:hypothetical protein
MVKIIAKMTQHIPRTPRTIPAMEGGPSPANPELSVDPGVLAAVAEELDTDASDGNSSPGWSM